MAELNSQFFNGHTYSATDFVESNKNVMSDGVLPNTEFFKVLPAGNMAIGVTSGRGWVQGHSFNSAETIPLTIGQADGTLDRIDTVIIRLDLTTDAEKIECKVIKGTLSAGATAPVRNGTYYDLVIAHISVAHGITAITSGMIMDKRPDNTLCGWSGAVSALGIQIDGKAEKVDVGDKTALSTTAKDNLVNAINEVKAGNANANAIKLQGKDIATTAPTVGQMLQFNGSKYVPKTCEYVCGVFTGDGAASRNIDVGFQPSMVMVGDMLLVPGYKDGNCIMDFGTSNGGIATPASPATKYTIVDGTAAPYTYGNVNVVSVNATGFTVYYSIYSVGKGFYGSGANKSNQKRFYIAFR